MAKAKKKTVKKNYTIDQGSRVVSFVIGTLSAEEEKEITKLQGYGYTIEALTKKKRKVSKGVTYDDMKKAAKGKPYEQELLDKISAKENYMKVLKWFKEVSSK